jgi:hypothetical protein
MPRKPKTTYVELPRFKKVHAALMECARCQDVALLEIERAMGGRRSPTEEALLNDTSQRLRMLRSDQLQLIRRFVVGIENGDATPFARRCGQPFSRDDLPLPVGWTIDP